MKAFLVTGATGFLGKQLVLELCIKHPGAPVLAFVRAQSLPEFRAWLARSPVDTSAVVTVEADVTTDGCGLTPECLEPLAGHELHVFHCAAYYDLDDDDVDRNQQVNVQGTANALALAESLGAVGFHHASSIAVAGDYRGVWTETHFDEAQRWRNNYGRSKHQAERLVREATVRVRTVLRFGVLVGDERTGGYFKGDGIYGYFDVVRTLTDSVPSAVPLPCLGWGSVPLYPVDVAAAAAVALGDAGQPGLSVHHLFEEHVRRADDLIRLVYEAAGHSSTINLGWLGHPLESFNDLVGHDRVLSRLRSEVLGMLGAAGVPVSLLPELSHATRFDSRVTAERLRDLGLRATDVEDYLPRLWHGWRGETQIADRTSKAAFFAGKTVLLTGASSGIGRAVMARLLARGATVIALGRDRDRLERTLQGVDPEDVERVVFVACDLLDDQSVEQAIAEIRRRSLVLDAFIHSAGISVHRELLDMSPALTGVARMTQVNFLSAVRLIREFLPDLRERDEARVVTLSSISAQLDIPGFGAYSATKVALDQLLRTLATENLGSGVKFTSVYLPLVKSPMTDLNVMLRNVPMLSESAAAELVLEAAVAGRPTAGTSLGRVFEALRVISPATGPLVSGLGFKTLLKLPYFARLSGAGLEIETH